MVPMRFLPALALVAFALLTGSAHAILLGAANRDPNGLRRSVVSIENSIGELCSGAVIAPDLVLTAAHCLTDQASYRVVAVNRAFRAQRLRIVAAAVHPAFVPGTTPRTQPGVDLAIVKLERPLGPDFLPFDPSLSGRIDAGEAVTIAGFGVSSERVKGTARTLRQTNLVSLGPVQVANRGSILNGWPRPRAQARAGAIRAGPSWRRVRAATGSTASSAGRAARCARGCRAPAGVSPPSRPWPSISAGSCRAPAASAAPRARG